MELVETVSLDEYVSRAGIMRLDAIKIDVDGYEYKVAAGARETLRRFKPHLLMEVGAYTLRAAGDSIESLIALLRSLGYDFYSEITMRRFPTDRQLIDAIPDGTTINVVCRHETKP
jgi:methyltransferase FkbM-like protein